MDEQDLVDVEVTHENADDLSDAVAAASASKAAEGDATDFPAHRRTVVANRLLAGQPDTELRSLSEVDDDQVKLLEHQVDAAHRALFEMNGKALLADEVGLGKTIEVGMDFKRDALPRDRRLGADPDPRTVGETVAGRTRLEVRTGIHL